MLDRLGLPITVGQYVKVLNHSELDFQYNWCILAFIEYPNAVEAVLHHYVSKEVAFISLLDIEKEF